MQHFSTRVRHEVKRRPLVVRQTKRLSSHMLRITFEGRELSDFTSPAPDDHVKLLIPTGGGEFEMRDYTPRSFDVSSNTLEIDFALHDAGPATRWAMQAKSGDALDIAGPKGSVLMPWTYDWWLLVGDETALPAIGRRVEEAPSGTKIISIVAVSLAEDEQVFSTVANHSAIWVHRPAEQADDPQPLIAALAEVSFPVGDGFVWIAAEGRVARAVRDYVSETRGHPRSNMKASGYWAKGKSNGAESLDP